ncbi:Beta-glucuronidase [Gossypium arboreum]|uniref:Beta-glucuronidase n=1 Tax=Gossypium arboreum TaxID=29729 RepID=A0A0B0MC54_GOSAR|nr:Beta-glucuronidase [Gossypium arboreum]
MVPMLLTDSWSRVVESLNAQCRCQVESGKDLASEYLVGCEFVTITDDDAQCLALSLNLHWKIIDNGFVKINGLESTLQTLISLALKETPAITYVLPFVLSRMAMSHHIEIPEEMLT